MTKVLGLLIEERGEPGHVRSDNGSEFVAKAVKSYLEEGCKDVLR